MLLRYTVCRVNHTRNRFISMKLSKVAISLRIDSPFCSPLNLLISLAMRKSFALLLSEFVALKPSYSSIFSWRLKVCSIFSTFSFSAQFSHAISSRRMQLVEWQRFHSLYSLSFIKRNCILMRYPLLPCTKDLTLIKGISHFSPFSSIQLGIFSAGRLTTGQAQWVAIVWILLWFGGEKQ